MFGDNDESSRREFLQQLGIGVAGAWGIGTLPPLATTQPQISCPAVPHGAAILFRRDCRPIRPRQVADRLTPAEVNQLKAAYQAMRALDTSDPNDPRGFIQQANVHCFSCTSSDPAIQPHFSWKFFAWHRAYLYFHERILGKLINNENFRLPFWGWDSPSYHKLPVPYVTPNDASNPLFNGTRGLASSVALPDEDVGPTVISNVLALGSFDEFGGTATGSGTPENTPHGAVHGDVGGATGDMSFFSSAARDPIFYQHHATVDKLWSDWNKGSSAHTNPTSSTFLNTTFGFFDENKNWRTITAAQVLDHENSLRYVYEPYRFLDRFLCLRWVLTDINWKATLRIAIPRDNRRLQSAASEATPLRIEIRGLQLPRNRTTVYRVYSNAAEAQADHGPQSPSYIGNVGFVLSDRANSHVSRGTINTIFTVSPSARSALARGDSLQPYLVDRNEKPGSKRPFALRAENVLLSVGEMDQER